MSSNSSGKIPQSVNNHLAGSKAGMLPIAETACWSKAFGRAQCDSCCDIRWSCNPRTNKGCP